MQSYSKLIKTNGQEKIAEICGYDVERIMAFISPYLSSRTDKSKYKKDYRAAIARCQEKQQYPYVTWLLKQLKNS